jgi:hypothetical protein
VTIAGLLGDTSPKRGMLFRNYSEDYESRVGGGSEIRAVLLVESDVRGIDPAII